MARLCESDFMIGSYLCGKIYVKSLRADSALYPRLKLECGADLTHLPNRDGDTSVPYRITHIAGDLRLDVETGPVVGPLQCRLPSTAMESNESSFDHSFDLFCDLNQWTLEGIEEVRSGVAPVFYRLYPGFSTVKL